ncbi:hypothetical protein [uncultured Bacteroides sp.]|uniref:hypothetical protein n=1 Tax=uncultured Bacteroides sp. TaxID=162156 RepID=UPI002593166B|nr:hypothetical protein [uncultured Bacteroides sp.]
MYSLLFDIRQETGRVRVTVRLACLISRKGNEVYYTDSSDSVFTSGLLKKGIGRVLYPDDLHWFVPDLTLLDLLLQERAALYRRHGIDYLFVTTQEEAQNGKLDAETLYLPPSPYTPLSKGAREADFIEKLEEIKERRAATVIISILEKGNGCTDNAEQAYQAIRRHSADHPDHQFVVLTNQGKADEKLFALPDNIAVYRPQDLQALLPLCDLALVADDWNIQTECVFAHVPALVLLPREIRRMTPHKLSRRIMDMLGNRECLVEQQKTLCSLYEQENQRLDEVADRLIQYIDTKKQKR